MQDDWDDFEPVSGVGCVIVVVLIALAVFAVGGWLDFHSEAVANFFGLH